MKERSDLNPNSEKVKNDPLFYINPETLKVYEFDNASEQYDFIIEED